MMSHWDDAYAEGATSRSWYQPHADVSMELLDEAAVPLNTPVLDVGGGASTFVDDLLTAGYADITVLDLAPSALELARSRLGADSAARVSWLAADVLRWHPERHYGVWHDRAVLHFMVTAAEQTAYRQAMLAGTAKGAVVIVGTFGPDGPERCSGLPVRRYGVEDMADFLGEEFTVVASRIRVHRTPSGGEQQFLWVSARRVR